MCCCWWGSSSYRRRAIAGQTLGQKQSQSSGTVCWSAGESQGEVQGTRGGLKAASIAPCQEGRQSLRAVGDSRGLERAMTMVKGVGVCTMRALQTLTTLGGVTFRPKKHSDKFYLYTCLGKKDSRKVI